MKTQSCVNCDKVIDDGVKFCPNCGVLLDESGKSDAATNLQAQIAEYLKGKLRLDKDVLVVSVEDADIGFDVEIELEVFFDDYSDWGKEKLPGFSTLYPSGVVRRTTGLKFMSYFYQDGKIVVERDLDKGRKFSRRLRAIFRVLDS